MAGRREAANQPDRALPARRRRDNVDWPDEDLPARSQPETDTEPEPEQVDEPEPVDDLPTDLPATGTLALPAAEPTWPGNDDLSAGETTEVLTAVEETGFLPAEGTLPERMSWRDWLLTPWYWLLNLVARIVDVVATTVRLSARWELEHDRTVARLLLVTASALVLAAVGVAYVLLAVLR